MAKIWTRVEQSKRHKTVQVTAICIHPVNEQNRGCIKKHGPSIGMILTFVLTK